MKFLLLLVVVLVAAWAWRANRPLEAPKKHKPTEPQPQDMVSCARCGVHFPKADAVAGRDGLYCCAEHRQHAES